MNLPTPPQNYSARFQTEMQRALEQADRYNLKQNQRLELAENGTEAVLVAPDGGKWKLTVDNSGNLQTTSVV